MASTVKFLNVTDPLNEIALAEFTVGNDTDKANGVAGTYIDYYYGYDNGDGLDPATPFDPAVHKQLLAIDNTLFTADTFEVAAKEVVNKVVLGDSVAVAFITDGTEIKRRNIIFAGYWFFIEDGKFREKLRVTLDQLA